MDSFEEGLAAIRKMALEKRGPEVLAKYAEGIEALRRANAADRAPKPGAAAPDFALPNAMGETVESAALRRKGPMIVTFYRGGWCPYCNLELREYQKLLPEIEDLGASLVAISPQTPDSSLSTKEKNALEFEVLSDVDSRAAQAFGLDFRIEGELREIYRRLGNDLAKWNGDESWRLPIPATFVVDAAGRVVWSHVDVDYTRRADPREALAALKAAANS
jgi:peroxiredoxin